MSEFQVTIENLDDYIDQVTRSVEKNGLINITHRSGRTGKWGMARLWRKWMQVTTDEINSRPNPPMMPYCIINGDSKGLRPFNQQDAHEMYTSYWLGLDKDGNRLSWAKDNHDGMRAASKGERFLAMMKHEEYCIDRAITLPIPMKSEYWETKKEHDGIDQSEKS